MSCFYINNAWFVSLFYEQKSKLNLLYENIRPILQIPRKTLGATGLKSDGSFNKDTMPEELIAL